MAATFYSDLKSSLAVLLNLSCLLFSALLAQYLTENPLLMIGSIAFLFLSSMMFGVWGWSVFTMIGGLVLSAESVPTLLAFFFLLRVVFTLTVPGRKTGKRRKRR